MRHEIDSYVTLNDLKISVVSFLEQWAAYGSRQLNKLPFKRDLRGWNDGPTAMKPKAVFACMQWSKHEGDECVGVYEIWERADGFGQRVFKFDSMEDYDQYNPSQEAPHAIKNEIGLCVDYHKGQ